MYNIYIMDINSMIESLSFSVCHDMVDDKIKNSPELGKIPLLAKQMVITDCAENLGKELKNSFIKKQT